MPRRPRTTASSHWRRVLPLAALLLPGLLPATLRGDDPAAPRLPLADEPALVAPSDAASAEQREAAVDAEFPDAAALNFDSDVDRSLRRIGQLIDAGRPADALHAWQDVLDGVANTGPYAGQSRLRSFVEFPERTWTTFADRTYARYPSIAHSIERTLAELPEEVRGLYELEVGGDATSLLRRARAESDPVLLRQVVDRYFVTNVGDDAAFQLAQLAIDRREFTEASRLLERVRNDHPNPRISDEWLTAALIACYARLGETDRARDVWSEYRAAHRTVGNALAEVVDRALARDDVGLERPRGTTAWTTRFGNPGRTGLRPDVPADALDARLTEAWSLPLDVTPHRAAPPGLEVGLPQDRNAAGVSRTLRAAQSGWRDLKLFPTARPLVLDGRVYVRGDERVLCLDAETGRVVWMGRRNDHDVNAASRNYGSRLQQFGQFPRRPSDDEIRRLCDRVHPSMTITGGLLFAIEGPLLDGDEDAIEPTTDRRSGNGQRRIRRNWLAAYEADTGKFAWRRPAADPGPFDASEVGFLAAPVGEREHLLVPVTRSGEVWLKALDRDTGQTVWSTMLCDEPPSSSSPWSPSSVAIAGDRAYVVPGTGLVFCVDVPTGNVEWAVRYERSNRIQLTRADRRRLRSPSLDFHGWNEDTAVVHGRLLLVFASDSEYAMAFDRRTGSHAWETPATPAEGADAATEFLGTCGDAFLVMGPNVVRRYRAAECRLDWETRVESPLARGLVTSRAVYVPHEDGVRVLDVETGEPTAELRYVTPTDQPPGNLFSDGDRLLAVDPSRVYGLMPLDDRLEQLATRIDAGDLASRLERARLLARLDEFDRAEADIVAAVTTFDPESAADADAVERVLATVSELNLPGRRPVQTLRLFLGEAGAAFAAVVEADDEFRALRNGVLYEAMSSVAKDSTPPAEATVALLADAAARTGEAYLVDATRQAAARSATEADVPAIRAGLDSGAEPRRLVAVAALESDGLDDELARSLLEPLLEDDRPAMRLEAVISLLNRGDRAALARLVALLESGDEDVRARTLRSLRVVTGQRFGVVGAESEEERLATITAWSEWVEESGETAELQTPLRRARLLVGRTLVTNARSHDVTEYDAEGKKVWEVSVRSPHGCFGTPQEHRLVSSYQEKSVQEYDRDGKLVWSLTGLPGRPFGISRLANGNTLVAFYDTGEVHEYDRGKNLVWKADLRGTVSDADRLPDGRTLVTWFSQNAIVEVDRDGEVVWRLNDMHGPRTAQRLPNGNTLVAQYRKARVVEVDREGNVVWRKEDLNGVQSAQRLLNGNTLVVHNAGVTEFAPDGRTVWQHGGTGHSRAHRF